MIMIIVMIFHIQVEESKSRMSSCGLRDFARFKVAVPEQVASRVSI